MAERALPRFVRSARRALWAGDLGRVPRGTRRSSVTRFDPTAPLETRAAQALEFAQTQVQALITNHPDYFPLYTEDGKWQHGREAWTNWYEGFLGGMMWIFTALEDSPP